MHAEARRTLEDAAKACFLEGAPLRLKQMLLSLGINRSIPPTIHELCQAAEQFDNIYKFTPDKISSIAATRDDPAAYQAFAAAHAAAQTDPNSMDIDNMQLHHFETNLRQMAVNALRHASSPSALRPLDAEERRRLQASRSCFRCRQPGHLRTDALT
ncbi:hypothetical protein BGX28_002317, partial [Mortierella sp. GBA30]